MPDTENDAETPATTNAAEPVFMGTRAEHLAACKQRALEYADLGDLSGAMASMGSDLNKHPETRGHSGMELMMMLAMGGHLNSRAELRKFIEGFQ